MTHSMRPIKGAGGLADMKGLQAQHRINYRAVCIHFQVLVCLADIGDGGILGFI